MANELRFRKQSVQLSNQQIVELAYVTKEVCEATQNVNLTFDSQNCYQACFCLCKDLLNKIPKRYRDRHSKLVAYYEEAL